MGVEWRQVVVVVVVDEIVEEEIPYDQQFGVPIASQPLRFELERAAAESRVFLAYPSPPAHRSVPL